MHAIVVLLHAIVGAIVGAIAGAIVGAIVDGIGVGWADWARGRRYQGAIRWARRSYLAAAAS